MDDRLNNVKQLEEKRQNAIKALADEKENIKKRADRKVDEYAQERLDRLDKLWSEGKKADIGFNEKSKIKGDIRKLLLQLINQIMNSINISANLKKCNPGISFLMVL